MTASACGPSSSSGRLRCSRTSRSTCATASRPNRSTTSTSNPSSTPQPSTNGSTSSALRRGRVLAAERLHDVGELREQQREQRPRDELGDAAAARGRAFERAGGVRLHEHRVGLREQRRAQPFDVLAAEVAQVGVDPADDVAGARVQRLPHRVALARARPGLGQHRRLGDDPGARPRSATAAVSSVEPSSSTTTSRHELEADRLGDDGADGRRLVARRQAHRHPGRQRGRLRGSPAAMWSRATGT